MGLRAFLRLICLVSVGSLLGGCILDDRQTSALPETGKWKKVEREGVITYECPSCGEGGAVVLVRSVNIGPRLRMQEARAKIVDVMNDETAPALVEPDASLGKVVLVEKFSAATISGRQGFLGRYNYFSASDATPETARQAASNEAAASDASQNIPAAGYMFLVPNGEALIVLQSIAADKREAANYLREFATKLNIKA